MVVIIGPLFLVRQLAKDTMQQQVLCSGKITLPVFLPLPPYTGNPNVRLALRATSENGFDIAIDEITVENACPTVNTLSASAVGFSTATLKWEYNWLWLICI